MGHGRILHRVFNNILFNWFIPNTLIASLDNLRICLPSQRVWISRSEINLRYLLNSILENIRVSVLRIIVLIVNK